MCYEGVCYINIQQLACLLWPQVCLSNQHWLCMMSSVMPSIPNSEVRLLDSWMLWGLLCYIRHSNVCRYFFNIQIVLLPTVLTLESEWTFCWEGRSESCSQSYGAAERAVVGFRQSTVGLSLQSQTESPLCRMIKYRVLGGRSRLARFKVYFWGGCRHRGVFWK